MKIKRSFLLIISLSLMMILSLKVNCYAEPNFHSGSIYVEVNTGGKDGMLINLSTKQSLAATYGITYNSSTNTVTCKNTSIGGINYSGSKDLNIKIEGTVRVIYNPEYYYWDMDEPDEDLRTGFFEAPAALVRTHLDGSNGNVIVEGSGKDSSKLVLEGAWVKLVSTNDNMVDYKEDQYGTVSFSNLTVSQGTSAQTQVYNIMGCNKCTVTDCDMKVDQLTATSLLTVKNSTINCRIFGSYKKIDVQNSKVTIDNSKVSATGDAALDQEGLIFGTVDLHGERLYGGSTKAEYQLDPTDKNLTNMYGNLTLSSGSCSYKMINGKKYLLITQENLNLPMKNSNKSGTSTTARTGFSSSPAVNTKLTVGKMDYVVTKRDSQVAFAGPKNKKATSCNIPNTIKAKGHTYKVTSIKNGAFKNNKKLTSVIIGKNVASIGKSAFAGCSKLKKVTIKTLKLKKNKVGANAFKGIKAKAVIRVPKKKLKAYKKILLKKGVKKKAKFKGI